MGLSLVHAMSRSIIRIASLVVQVENPPRIGDGKNLPRFIVAIAHSSPRVVRANQVVDEFLSLFG
jgi:hypothetical protein